MTPPDESRRNGPAVPATARTLAAFEVFAREKRPLTTSELARFLDLRESSCSDLLNTLHLLGYVSRTASSRRYYPTGRLVAVATAISENDPMTALGNEAASLLCQKSGETSIFGAIDGAGVKIIAVSESTQRLRYVVTAGDRATLHATSLGKALLGASAEADVKRLLRLKPLVSFTATTCTHPTELELQIAAQRERGWYSASEEGGEGISSFAIAGWTNDGLAALSLIGPTQRLVPNEEKYVKILQDVAATVFASAGAAQRPEDFVGAQRSERSR